LIGARESGGGIAADEDEASRPSSRRSRSQAAAAVSVYFVQVSNPAWMDNTSGMQHEIDALHRLGDSLRVADVTFYNILNSTIALVYTNASDAIRNYKGTPANPIKLFDPYWRGRQGG
jgi:hypothetical protein